MIAKHKPIRLHGKALAALNDAIHERDGHRCIKCGAYVDPGEKWHHEPPGAGRKSDEIEKGVLLCHECHTERHHGDVIEVKEICENYLKNRYGSEAE